jgi:hypothetical protein
MNELRCYYFRLAFTFGLLFGFSSFALGSERKEEANLKICKDQTYIYHFNSCDGIQKRIASRAYKICRFKSTKREIFSFFPCVGDSHDKVATYRVDMITTQDEADYLVSELRNGLKKDPSKRVQIERAIEELRSKYPTHTGL